MLRVLCTEKKNQYNLEQTRLTKTYCGNVQNQKYDLEKIILEEISRGERPGREGPEDSQTLTDIKLKQKQEPYTISQCLVFFFGHNTTKGPYSLDREFVQSAPFADKAGK